jgi:hypothetical protein
MPKAVLYIIIAVLLALVVYLLAGSPNLFSSPDEEAVSTSTITVGEPQIESIAPVPVIEDEPVQNQTVTSLALSGSLVRFIEAENDAGVLTVYALIDDSTEMIRVDMHQVVTPGVSSPQDQLGLTLGQRVTVRGQLDNGVFVVTEIE